MHSHELPVKQCYDSWLPSNDSNAIPPSPSSLFSKHHPKDNMVMHGIDIQVERTVV